MAAVTENLDARESLLSQRLGAVTERDSVVRNFLDKITLNDRELNALKVCVQSRFDVFMKADLTLSLEAGRRAFAAQLTRDAAKTGAIVGAITSLPLRLPFVGSVTPFLFRLGFLYSYSTRAQTELVYSLAALYDYPWRAAELRTIAFILIGLGDYEDIKKFAATVGVRLSVKKLVEKVASYVAVELAAYGLEEMYGPVMIKLGAERLLTDVPFYLTPVKYLPSAALGAWFSHRSMKSVGRRAQYFFDSEEEG